MPSPGRALRYFAYNEQFVDGDSGFGILDAGLAVSGLALAVARPAARPAGAGSAAGQLHDGSTGMAGAGLVDEPPGHSFWRGLATGS
jgi:hypothetical protein